MRQENPQAQQLTPQQQLEQQLASKEKELQFESRFTSNIAYARAADSPSHESALLGAAGTRQPGGSDPNSSLIAPHAPGEGEAAKRATEVNLDSATGPLYVLREGVTVDSILMNRLDGDAAGPVKVLVSNPVYSHDLQNVLIPEGTVILGEARKIGAAGFGQQRRMAVVFHRMLMPDGYSVDLDQFRGLDQTGEMGLKDMVNNHYLQIFGTSIALGVIAGAAQIEQGGGALTGSGSQLFTTGASSSVSQSATTILDRFMQIPPTITIREGHRVKIYLTQDMVLPAYKNHTIPQSF
jgi:type IV secretion system protein VirB10